MHFKPTIFLLLALFFIAQPAASQVAPKKIVPSYRSFKAGILLGVNNYSAHHTRERHGGLGNGCLLSYRDDSPNPGYHVMPYFEYQFGKFISFQYQLGLMSSRRNPTEFRDCNILLPPDSTVIYSEFSELTLRSSRVRSYTGLMLHSGGRLFFGLSGGISLVAEEYRSEGTPYPSSDFRLYLTPSFGLMAGYRFGSMELGLAYIAGDRLRRQTGASMMHSLSLSWGMRFF